MAGRDTTGSGMVKKKNVGGPSSMALPTDRLRSAKREIAAKDLEAPAEVQTMQKWCKTARSSHQDFMSSDLEVRHGKGEFREGKK